MPGKLTVSLAGLFARLPYLLLGPVIAVSFLSGSVILGLWESLTFYHTFGAVDAPLSFLIAPRANIAGQGYAFLEAVRSIILGFHLPLNLTTFRIPSVFFGVVSLLIFFKICRRYFGPWPALGATALLAVNQVFFQVEHMMSVLVISGAALLFLFERLQALEVRYWNLKVWMGLALSMVLVALHYGPARIFAVILIGTMLGKMLWLLRETPGSIPIQRSLLVLGGYSVAAFLGILALLDYRNFLSFLRFSTFLFPHNSDIAVLQYSTDSDGVSGLSTTLQVNIRILLNSIFAQVGDYHSQYSSYFLADYRYPIMDRLSLPLAALGVVVAVIGFKRRTIIYETPWGNIIAILSVFALPLLFSVVIAKPAGPTSSLSVHRMYFCLFPLYLLVAAFLHWLQSSDTGRFARYGVTAYMLAVFSYQLVGLVNEHSRFKDQVFTSAWQKHGTEINGLWDDGMPNIDRQDVSFASHLQQHAQYANVAKEIANKFRLLNPGASEKAKRRIVFVDVNKFSESPISPASLDYIAHRNYHSIFLALYAGQEGVQLNPIVMVSQQSQPLSPNLGYQGKPRKYSAQMDLDERGQLVYKKGEINNPVLIQITGNIDDDLLVTTPEEEEGAIMLLEKSHTPYEHVRI